MKIKDLLDDVGGEIFARGENYYNNDYISFLTYNPQKHSYYVEVEGNGFKDYTVRIELNENNDITFYDCNCPYDWSNTCKHIITVCLAIENGKYIESTEKHIESIKNY